jgi:6-phosphofructokinase 1|tara:strand:- start:502 stop:1473 length:972 start_codon:yes stop_codon:yes gene_type:complete
MKKIAVLTSGGDSPGMNAAIRAVVRSSVYNGVDVCGVFRGFSGLIEGDFKDLKVRSVANILGRGGTILKSDRCEEFRTVEGRKRAYENLISEGVEGLVVIGGNGTFTGALMFHEEHGFPVVGLPGTIDNDLAGTDNTIGFDTATNTAVEAVDKIRDTADSHNRLFFIEVMGRDSGFIALSTGIATGAIAVMTPETGTTVNDLINVLEKAHERKKSSSIVIVAEGDDNGGAYEIAKRVIEITDKYDVRITVLGHLQRGGSPTCADRVLASRLGVEAVESLLKGDVNCMIGVVNDKLVHTDFETAINNKKNTLKDEVRLAQILSI